jgi:hypothetical protein
MALLILTHLVITLSFVLTLAVFSGTEATH